MSLGMCAPCEKLFLFEEDPATQVAFCPRCDAALTPKVVQSMEDLPRFPFQLVRGTPTRCLAKTAAA